MTEDAVARRLVEGLFDPEAPSTDPSLRLSMAYARLLAVMEPVFGELGFNAMFISSVRLTQARHPLLSRVSASATGGIVESLWSVLRDEPAEDVHALGVDLLVGFYQVLARFIGESLSTQLFRDAGLSSEPSTASPLPETP